jgi:putative NADH-flavin reductase
MKFAVFGATGRTGIQIIIQALEAGHEITVLVRDPAKLEVNLRSKLRIVRGSSIDAQPVGDAVSGCEAVLSALGHTGGSPSNLLSQSASTMIAAMKKENVTRLVVLSNVAARDPNDKPSFYNRFLLTMLTLFRGRMARDTAEEARIISQSRLEWTIVRANLLTAGPLTKKFRVGKFDPGTKTRISRADVADFMISCVVEGKYIREKPVISE